MILSAETKRCQGRPVRAAVGSCLARECTSCVRRTDIPAGMQSVPWMHPPKITPPAVECPLYIVPFDICWEAVE